MQLLPYLPLSSDGNVNDAAITLQSSFLSLFLSSFSLKWAARKQPCLNFFSQGTPTMKILQKCLISSLVSKKTPTAFPLSYFTLRCRPSSFLPSLPRRGGDRERGEGRGGAVRGESPLFLSRLSLGGDSHHAKRGALTESVVHVNIYAYCAAFLWRKNVERKCWTCVWAGRELMMGQPAALRICNKPDWHTHIWLLTQQASVHADWPDRLNIEHRASVERPLCECDPRPTVP